MTNKALIRRLQISCLGLDHVDPLRLLVDDVIEALRENAMREVQRLGQEIEQEPVAWRNAALRVGEDLCSVGPFGYYDMTAQEWLDWALSVVTVHAPPSQRTWVDLTDEEIDNINYTSAHMLAKEVEARLKEKNT